MELYIGIMSGTSADGIDTALVDFSDNDTKIIATQYIPYSSEIRLRITTLCQPGEDELNHLGELDVLLGKAFASSVNILLEKNTLHPKFIKAIGSHGHTIRHHPQRQFSLQIGDPNIIATETGITTITDFRRRDIALGGQGAPLVPAFHQSIFSKIGAHCAVVNIGGIANATILTDNIVGFDTGPGNTLLDAWINKHLHTFYDENGKWAGSGNVKKDLLKNLLSDPYFDICPPKSTGREYFNLSWLEKYLPENIHPEDVQATLVELTAESIVRSTKEFIAHGDIFVCGGGVHNQLLMHRLQSLAKNFHVKSTHVVGIDPDFMEAIAFAWLAKQTLSGKPGNVTSVTGAKNNAILGGIYFC